MRRLALITVLVLLAGGCRNEKPLTAPKTPEKALAALRQALAGTKPEAPFRLLDQQSRWSLESIHKDLSAACGLVRQHYPAERKARALERCPAGTSDEAASLLLDPSFRREVLAPLTGLGPPEGRRAAAGGAVELRSGGAWHRFCREGGGWAYCGQREALEERKVKAARDLLTVQENVQSFQER